MLRLTNYLFALRKCNTCDTNFAKNLKNHLSLHTYAFVETYDERSLYNNMYVPTYL